MGNLFLSLLNLRSRRKIENQNLPLSSCRHSVLARLRASFHLFVLVFLLQLVSFTPASAQLERPALFFSHTEMSAYNAASTGEFRLFWAWNSYLRKSIEIPATGSYRIDFSGFAWRGSPTVVLLIDGVQVGSVNFPAGSTNQIWSVFVNQITAGSHVFELKCPNASGMSVEPALNMVYFTKTTRTTAPAFPATTLTSLPAFGSSFLTSDHFMIGRLRGFNAEGDLSKASLDAMKATGANLARRAIILDHDASGNYKFKDGQLASFNTLLSHAQANGYYVVPAFFIEAHYGWDYWNNSAKMNSILNLWTQFASTYKDSKAIAGYNLLNEPGMIENDAQYVRFAEQMINTVRAVDVNHAIIVEQLSATQWISSVLPLPYNNLVYSIHNYATFGITHQGTNVQTKIRVPYPVTQPVLNPDGSVHEGIFGLKELYASYADAYQMKKRFNVPMYIGEFSTVGWAAASPRGNGTWSSTEYVKDQLTVLEEYGFAWSYFAWRAYEAWDAEIPSSWWNTHSYIDAKPQGWNYNTAAPQRSSTAPTMMELKKWFALNTAPTTTTADATATVTSTVGCGILSGTIIGTAGSWNNSGNTKEKAFDKSISTFFDAPTANGNWVGYDLGSAGQVCKVRFYPRSGYTGRMVNGKFQGSNSADFSVATDLHTITAEPTLAWQEVTISNTSSFRYVRYLSPGNGYGNIAELEFYGNKSSTMSNQSSSSRINILESPTSSTSSPDIFMVEAFPNPSTSYFNLKIQSPDNEPIMIRLVDLSGRVLEVKTSIQSNSTNQIGSLLPRGNYMVEVIQGTRRTVKKITKM